MFLVLGLGNPGNRYEKTRHNVGFLVAERLAERCGGACTRSQGGALIDKVLVGREPVVIAKPQSFMNRSGGPAVALRGFYKVDNPHIVVVHDDLNLSFGTVRLKRGGGHGGHNGLRDIQAQFGASDFLRVRVGISRPAPGRETASYVLGAWSAQEIAEQDDVVDAAVAAVEAVVREGVDVAMNSVNRRESTESPSEDVTLRSSNDFQIAFA